jgi:hypothetical protein
MSRRRTTGRSRRRESKAAGLDPGETETSVAATVAWMLATSTVLLCDVGAFLMQLAAAALPGNRGVTIFRDLLLFGGLVAGVVTLALLPVVYRLRRVAPPTGVTAFAACAALAPMVALAVRALR